MTKGKFRNIVEGSCSLLGLLIGLYGAALFDWDTTSATEQNRGVRQEIAGHHILKRFYPADKDMGQGVWFYGPTVLFEDKDDRHWIGNVLGAFTYTEHRDEWVAATQRNESTSFVWGIYQDHGGSIWIVSGSEPRINRFDGTKWRQMTGSSPSASFRLGKVMFGGRAGDLWFLSSAGLVKFDGYHWAAPLEIPENTVKVYRELARPRATDPLSQALADVESLINGSSPFRRNDEKLPAILAEITSGIEDNDRCIWLCAERGILSFDIRNRAWKVYPLPGRLTEASRVYEDRSGRLWFSDDLGNVSVYEKSTDNWRSYSLAELVGSSLADAEGAPNPVHAIYQDRRGQMLFATQRGLIVLSSKGKWQVLTALNSGLPDNRVTAISEDRSHRIWLGTGGGIVVMEQ